MKNVHYFRGVAIAIAATLLTACGGGSGSKASPPTTAEKQGMLRNVANTSEFVEAIQKGFEQAIQNPDESPQVIDGRDSALANTDAESSFSATYRLEANVDEYDMVKYDGKHLYIAPMTMTGCCFIADSIALPADTSLVPSTNGSQARAIRILATDKDDASATQVGSIALGETESLLGLFIQGDQLASLSSSNYYGSYGAAWIHPESWSQQMANITIYNISDPAAPSLDWSISIEGGFVQSRKIGDEIFFITRHTPNIQGIDFYPATAEKEAANQRALEDLSLTDIIPKVTVNGSTVDLFDPADCLIPNEADPANENFYPSTPTITSITRVPINNPSAMSTRCYGESASGVYMSESSIYLTDVRYDKTSSKTRIHKLTITDTDIDYRGSAEVGGSLWTGGQNDFRINEYAGALRLLTTQWTDDENDRWDHSLYVLQEDASELKLAVAGQLPNSTTTEEIGKDNENLYGVRFLGERAYLVTFLQTDPLYVMDLSDATNPRIAGQLEIPGFSDFIHPVTDNLLLGVGQNVVANGRQIKLELFDVSNINAPLSVGTSLIGKPDQWTSSPAQWDRRAFTYLADVNGVDRFTIPSNTCCSVDDANNALYLFELHDKTLPNLASLNLVGEIKATNSQNFWGGQESRAVIHDDAVFFINGDKVWSALWGDSENQKGPQ